MSTTGAVTPRRARQWADLSPSLTPRSRATAGSRHGRRYRTRWQASGSLPSCFRDHANRRHRRRSSGLLRPVTRGDVRTRPRSLPRDYADRLARSRAAVARPYQHPAVAGAQVPPPGGRPPHPRSGAGPALRLRAVHDVGAAQRPAGPALLSRVCAKASAASPAGPRHCCRSAGAGGQAVQQETSYQLPGQGGLVTADGSGRCHRSCHLQ